MPQRQKIINELNTHIYMGYLSKTLTFNESVDLRIYMRDKLSLENLIGFKQLSIFDDVSDELFKDKKS